MEINKYFDHTILKADATIVEVEKICNEAKKYNFASVCVNSSYASYVTKSLEGFDIKTCCVVGFPLGAMSTNSKKYETIDAIKNGATEIDMVIHIGKLKSKDYDYVLEDIKEIKTVCKKYSVNNNIELKVILENCLLTKEEIIKVCELSIKGGADFVKTSTGFDKGGALEEDVILMRETVSGKIKIKASGGIRDLATANMMINAGANRLGTSATVAIIKEYEKTKL